jgi:hypothetical protein
MSLEIALHPQQPPGQVSWWAIPVACMLHFNDDCAVTPVRQGLATGAEWPNTQHLSTPWLGLAHILANLGGHVGISRLASPVPSPAAGHSQPGISQNVPLFGYMSNVGVQNVDVV